MHDEPGRQEMPMPDDDVALIRRVVNGDTAAFADLYRAHYRRLFAVCYRILGREAVAEDAVQDVFVKIYRALPAFRGDASFRTWAYRIAVRHCLEVLRAMPTDISSDHLSEAVAPDTQDAALTSVQVHDALRTLSPVYRTVLTLRFFEELSLQEIARAMASSLPVVKMRLHRAKRHLARALQGVVALEGLDHYLAHQAPTAPLPIPFSEYKAAEMYAAFTAHLTAVQLAKGTAATSPLWQILLVGGMIAVMLVTGYRQHKARPATEISKTQTTALERPIKAAQLRVTTARGTAVDPLSGIDPTLARNPRLQNGLNIDADSQRVEDILAAISRRVDVQLQADPQVADQLLFVRLHRMSAAGALTLIQRQLSLQWQVSGTTAAPVYTLAVTKQAAADIATARKAQETASWNEAIRTLRASQQMLANRTYDEYQLGAASFEWAHEMKALCALPKARAQWPKGQADGADILLLRDEIITALNKDGKWTTAAAHLTAEEQAFVPHFQYGKGTQPSALATFGFELQRRDDGSILLQSMTRYADGSGLGRTHNNVYESWGRRPPTSYYQDAAAAQQLTQLSLRVADADPAYRDQRLNMPLDNTGYTGYSSISTWAMLQQMAEQTPYQIVSDCYTLTRDFRLPMPYTTTLAERLALLDRSYNMAWTLSPDSILTLRHRNWPVLRESEPSKTAVNDLVAAFTSQHAFTIRDLGKMAGTNNLRNDAMFTLLHKRLERDPVFTRDANTYRELRLNTRGFLTAYAALTPEERTTASGPQGIAMADLAPEPQRAVANVAKTCGEPSRTMAAILRSPLRFRVQRRTTSYAELEKLGPAGYHGRCTMFGRLSAGGRDDKADYLVFDILDPRGPNVNRYALPVMEINGELYPAMNSKDAISATWEF